MKSQFFNLIFLTFFLPQLLGGQSSQPQYILQAEYLVNIDHMVGSENFMVGQLGYTHRFGQHLVGLQVGGGSEFTLFGGKPEGFWHAGPTYSKFMDVKNLHIGGSVGISFLHRKKKDYDNINRRNNFSTYQTIGIPLMAEFYVNLGKTFGIGIKAMTIINPKQTLFGIGMTYKAVEFSRTEVLD